MNNVVKKANFKRGTAAAMLLSTLGTVGVSVMQAPIALADEVNITQGMTHEDFINEIGPRAQKIAQENDLYASVMMAQAIVESGWGQSGLAAAPNYNLFGIKGAYNGQSVSMATTEFTGGTEHGVVDGFRKYNSYDESLQDNADVLSAAMYSGVHKSVAATYQDATAYLTGRYATNPQYNVELNKIIEQNNLTRFDEPGSIELKTPIQYEKVKVAPDYKIRENKKVEDVKTKTKAGDSLWNIARDNKVSIDQLQKWNANLNGQDVANLPGDLELKVNEKETITEVAYRTHTETNDVKVGVNAGDTIAKIGAAHQLSVEQVMEMNPEVPADFLIHVGDQIKVGEETKTFDKDLTADEKTAADKAAKEKEDKLNKEAEMKARAEAARKSGQATVAATSGNHAVHQSAVATDQAKAVIAEASKYLGTPYVWGGRTPEGGFDCSGLMQYVFRQATGMEIGSWTVPQESAGTIIPVSEAQPGDLYFWGAQGSTYHVALATGEGNFIHAPQPGDVVKEGSTQYFTPSFAVRVLK